jgi:hypothetical protein
MDARGEGNQVILTVVEQTLENNHKWGNGVLSELCGTHTLTYRASNSVILERSLANL